MAANTKIEWAHHTFNPWIGCTKIHAGCTNCYAEAYSKRTGNAEWGLNGTRVKTTWGYWRHAEKWNQQAEEGVCPVCEGGKSIREKKNPQERPCEQCDATGRVEPYRVRVFPSLCDPFEDWSGSMLSPHVEKQEACPENGFKEQRFRAVLWWHPMYDVCEGGRLPMNGLREGRVATMDDLRSRFFRLIDNTPNIDWLLLTKRPENVPRMWCSHVNTDGKPPSKVFRKNVWLLTSVSDQASAEKMLPPLLACRDLVPVLGVSLEPLLGRVDLEKPRPGPDLHDGHGHSICQPWLIQSLDWGIVGGESGTRRRDCGVHAIVNTAKQFTDSGVPVFVKQDCALQPGQQGRIPDDIWSLKQFPSVEVAA